VKKRRGVVLAAVVLVAAVGFVGCADDEPREPAAVAPATATTDTPAPSNEEVDGKLTTTDGRVIRAWGDPAEQRASIAAFKAMTTAFRDGRMEDACRYVTDFALSQFEPGGISGEAPCPAKLRALARVVERDGGPPTVRILWVRAYTSLSGVWVEDERGRRIRVPLNNLDGDGWQLELGVFPDPEILAARIAG
jgi:hypothetical protein